MPAPGPTRPEYDPEEEPSTGRVLFWLAVASAIAGTLAMASRWGETYPDSCTQEMGCFYTVGPFEWDFALFGLLIGTATFAALVAVAFAIRLLPGR